MAKKIYKNGKYTGQEILSFEEHRVRKRQSYFENVKKDADYRNRYLKGKKKRDDFLNNWHNTNWVWFLLLFCWPLGCYGIYKRCNGRNRFSSSLFIKNF